MADIPKLDVTQLPPMEKHPTIFGTFNNLKSGESFIIHNDHDPKPLHFQLKAQHGDVFEWEYLESGPEIWEIKITKKETA